MIFITGLHNKPQGCGASVDTVAGPFTTKNTDSTYIDIVSCEYRRLVIVTDSGSCKKLGFAVSSFES
jgi:hypothetical protein